MPKLLPNINYIILPVILLISQSKIVPFDV